MMTAHLKQVPGLLRDLQGPRREIAEQGISDLCAIMEPGLAALLAAVARGTHPAGAARCLWQEFCTARDAIAALVPKSSLR
ncbi:hypothetical protein [Novosphingobium sp. 9]|uniref:hypothetical protein n=1 Tax=Novosphingobium sp. 9 TaxID=2025349 RepID=UPI0021B4E950|nr:hypothetical protein [Novosphingobium sp. 9]